MSTYSISSSNPPNPQLSFRREPDSIDMHILPLDILEAEDGIAPSQRTIIIVLVVTVIIVIIVIVVVILVYK